MIIGLDSPDDAGVFRLNDDTALVQTVDFFTPIVDDPYWFGAIAAANALSDVYAMGGRPLTALNIAGFPVTKLPKQLLAEVLRGGADKVREAGAALLGGHSIDSPEPIYGLSVTGVIDPRKIGAKAGAKPGDVLLLTKPIGIGVITTAIKRGLCTEADTDEAIAVMAKLNNQVEALAPFAIAGMTDVTGFGLLGHASEMARHGGVGIRILSGQVPILDSAFTYAAQNVFPGGSRNNFRFLTEKAYVEFDPAIDETRRLLLCDAVTSGGLLIAVPREQAEAVQAALLQAGALTATLIGEVVADHPGKLMVI